MGCVEGKESARRNEDEDVCVCVCVCLCVWVREKMRVKEKVWNEGVCERQAACRCIHLVEGCG